MNLSMRQLAAAAFAATLVLACSATLSRPTNLRDGASCGGDGECASRSCLGGFCAGAHCTCNALAMCYRSGDCATGWVCPGATILQGSQCQQECATSASVCPKGYNCITDGDGKHCLYGGGGTPTLTVAITGTSSLEHGSPIVMHTDVTSSSPPVTITWTLVDIDTLAPIMPLGSGPDVNVKLMPAQEIANLGVRVVADDASGATGNGAIPVTFYCASAKGTACATSIAGFCCGNACDPGTMVCP
jgi:hypothetical protein